jgi:hypothetical protein
MVPVRRIKYWPPEGDGLVLKQTFELCDKTRTFSILSMIPEVLLIFSRSLARSVSERGQGHLWPGFIHTGHKCNVQATGVAQKNGSGAGQKRKSSRSAGEVPSGRGWR